MQNKTSDFKWSQLQRRDGSHSISPQKQWLSTCIDDSITKFDQHQENSREPIFSGATILSWVIGKAVKMSKAGVPNWGYSYPQGVQDWTSRGTKIFGSQSSLYISYSSGSQSALYGAPGLCQRNLGAPQAICLLIKILHLTCLSTSILDFSFIYCVI